MHYPPLGHRGFATYSRAGRYGQVDPLAHQERLVAETLVIGMIESPEGVDQLPRHPGRPPAWTGS